MHGALKFKNWCGLTLLLLTCAIREKFNLFAFFVEALYSRTSWFNQFPFDQGMLFAIRWVFNTYSQYAHFIHAINYLLFMWFVMQTIFLSQESVNYEQRMHAANSTRSKRKIQNSQLVNSLLLLLLRAPCVYMQQSEKFKTNQTPRMYIQPGVDENSKVAAFQGQ